MRFSGPFNVALKKPSHSHVKKYWDQSVSQLELCPSFTPRPVTQPCCFSLFPTCQGWRKEGWRQGGSPALQLLPSQTANTTCCTVSGRNCCPVFGVSSRVPHHSAAPRNDFTWPEMLWLRLQPDSCLGKGVRHYEAPGNSLHWALQLVFYLV